MLTMIPQLIIGLVDLVAAFLFMYGLQRMSSPATAPSGILVAGIGMLAAVLASFLYAFSVSAAAEPHLFVNVGLALIALIVGGGVAWWSGKTVAMTAMPQMVALYNGMGGGAAGAIAAVELLGDRAQGVTQLGVTLLGALIGAVSLSGSLIAWAKLDGVIKNPLRVHGQQVFNALVLIATLAIGAYIVFVFENGARSPRRNARLIIACFFGLALVFGVLMTLPIGGADMPVVISIYNAFTGLAVGLGGYVLQNPAMMIAGMVVGAAGMLLTLLMAKAMNRSVANVLFTNFGEAPKHKHGAIKGSLKPVEAATPASSCATPRRSSSCPATVSPSRKASRSSTSSSSCCRPRASRSSSPSIQWRGACPGQMDVLLAEAGVPYDLIFQLEDINDEFANADVALVIGANDVVNPAARTDKSSPIFGMPILNADKAKKVYVVKRGQGKGYAGIVNALFYGDNCSMVYGDAQAVLVKMIEAVRGLGTAAAA